MFPRVFVLFVTFLAIVGSGIGLAGAQDEPPVYEVLLPAVVTPPPPQPFGVNLPSAYVSTESVNYTRALNPRWAHGATISWTTLEPVQGEYHWDELAGIEQALTQLRAAGIEPIVLITDSPTWARKYPRWRCSPPADEHVGAFLTMLEQLSARYREGPAAVRYWEVWNEPDAFRGDIPPAEGGIGCWGERAFPEASGQTYGDVLLQATAALKRGNPDAKVLGGALTYWTADNFTVRFIDGMIASGAVAAIDALSFHAYGQANNDDWLLVKTTRLRKQLAEAGLGDKPLMATEVGAPCPQGTMSPLCDPQTVAGDAFVNVYQQRYAARIAAESLALGLQGSIWYPLVNRSPGFAYSHLIDVQEDQLKLRSGYLALRDSLWLLQGATYVGPPLQERADGEANTIRILSFQRPKGQLHVLWAHQETFSAEAQITIPVGARAVCWEYIGTYRQTTSDCTPADGGTVITRTVGADPQYIEVVE